MAQHSAGIQKLLHAEKSAAEIVDSARKRKTKRLKQAKEEAALEIEQYRQDRERHFREEHAKNQGSGEGFATQVEQQTQAQLQEVAMQVSQNKEAVIKRLLELVCDVKPEVHQNLQL